jgi:hypothetical protein
LSCKLGCPWGAKGLQTTIITVGNKILKETGKFILNILVTWDGDHRFFLSFSGREIEIAGPIVDNGTASFQQWILFIVGN